MNDCACDFAQIDLMFKDASQYIEEQITDRTYRQPKYWVSMFPMQSFPDGVGLALEKVRFFGDVGPQYDGLDGWRKLELSRNVNSAFQQAHDACGYKWEEVGHGLETQQYTLFERDLRTKPICIKDIRTKFHFKEVMNLVYQNLTNISSNMREQLNRNAAITMAVKHVAVPGLPFNTQNPYELPNILGATVGKLTYKLLLSLYHQLAQEAGQFAMGNIDGMPAFGVICHPETWFQMSYESADIRQDLRFSSMTDELFKRYNFLSAIGPFVHMADMYAPRYNRTATGTLERVFPFVRDIDIEIGTRPITNPAYHQAEYELVLLMTKNLFTLRTRKNLTTAGGQTRFGSQEGLFSWKWYNPECDDPYQRTGRYVATAEVGIEPGDFTDIPAILVKRKPGGTGVIEYWTPDACPPIEVDCDNVIPDQGCPCPTITAICNTVNNDELLITFDVATGLIATNTVNLKLSNGSFITGTVEAVNGLKHVISFPTTVGIELGAILGVECGTSGYCDSGVIGICQSVITPTSATITLARPVVCAVVGQSVQVTYGDGTKETKVISAVNTALLQITIPVTYDLCCEKFGVTRVCCVATEGNGCPACDAPVESCDPDNIENGCASCSTVPTEIVVTP